MKRIANILIINFFALAKLFSQTPIPIDPSLYTKSPYYGPTKIIVKLDPITGIPIGNVPFDRYFILRTYFASNIDVPLRVFMVYNSGKLRGKNWELSFYQPDASKAGDYDKSDGNLIYFNNAIDILVTPLLPKSDYLLLLVKGKSEDQIAKFRDVYKSIYDYNELAGEAAYNRYRKTELNPDNPSFKELKRYYTQRNLGEIFRKHGGDLAAATSDLNNTMKTKPYYSDDNNNQVFIFENILPAGAFSTEQYTVQTNASLRIVAEGGLIYTGFQKGFNSVTPYLGINISLRPFDSDISLSTLKKHNQIRDIDRFSLNIGLTLSSIAKTGYRSNLFGNDNILAGIGYKLNHYISLIGGGMIYNNNNPNPLAEKKTVGVAPYLGLSLNLKIKDALGDLAKTFSYGK